MRVRIDLAYDGGGFHGWAAQPGLRTVQQSLEEALATVLRLPEVGVGCAGRTDTGVHARGQVVQVDLAQETLAAIVGRSRAEPVDALSRRLNGILPTDIRVRRASVAPPGFDARFSALWRRYVYRIADRPELVDPLSRGHVLAWPNRLDESAMNQAAAQLVGLRDFAGFCKKRDGATTVRTLLELTWERRADGVLEATVRADAFCHNMVRSLVGCLVGVGEGNRPAEWAGAVLAAGVRDPGVRVMPARGLTLEEVGYPADADLASQAAGARRRRTLEDRPTRDTPGRPGGCAGC